MPVTIFGNLDGRSYDFGFEDLGYEYPRGQNFNPKSDMHKKIVNSVIRAIDESHRTMQSRYSHWQEMDSLLNVYVRPDEDSVKDDSLKVVIPVSFATLETLLSYMNATFIQDPIFKYNGTGPEDMLGAQMLEAVIFAQSMKFKHSLALNTMWRDAFVYGVGPVAVQWEEIFGYKTEVVRTGTFDRFLSSVFNISNERKKKSARMTLFEGNKLININAYTYFPDPSVSSDNIQDAQYIGWLTQMSYNDMLRMEEGDSSWFNVRYLKNVKARSKFSVEKLMAKDKSSPYNTDIHFTESHIHDILWFYCDIIPKDWGLGRKTFPEKWLLGVADDQVLIYASPLNLNHDTFPIAVASPDYDGYSPAPLSRMGRVSDLQNLINFMYNSHIQNVRKAVNDMWITDPSLVNINDLTDPKPGKIIRMRRAAWGGNKLDQAIKQFPVNDVTRSNIVDADLISKIMKEGVGASDILQGGIPDRTSRISSNEISGARMSGMSKMKRIAQIISAQAMQPIGFLCASHTQQLMTNEMKIRITGESVSRYESIFSEGQRGFINANPFDLVVDYDVIASDGMMPGSEDPQMWIQLYQTIASNPAIAPRFDMVAIFKHIAKQLGATNISDFENKQMPNMQAQVVPDESVAQQVQQGNLVQV